MSQVSVSETLAADIGDQTGQLNRTDLLNLIIVFIENCFGPIGQKIGGVLT
ncbi:hypothetical protein N836_17250 [Leptolyngbya sp. Heron Island J]|nr:hypothetical protein N836_17250 [Leptolyngbya sp. Heron Island J]